MKISARRPSPLRESRRRRRPGPSGSVEVFNFLMRGFSWFREAPLVKHCVDSPSIVLTSDCLWRVRLETRGAGGGRWWFYVFWYVLVRSGFIWSSFFFFFFVALRGRVNHKSRSVSKAVPCKLWIYFLDTVF